MNLENRIKELGITYRILAKRVGVHESMVRHWTTGRTPVSALKAIAIERATSGKIRRDELRPDIFGPEAA